MPFNTAAHFVSPSDKPTASLWNGMVQGIGDAHTALADRTTYADSWSSVASYPKYTIVRSGGAFFIALVDVSAGGAAPVDGATWRAMGGGGGAASGISDVGYTSGMWYDGSRFAVAGTTANQSPPHTAFARIPIRRTQLFTNIGICVTAAATSGSLARLALYAPLNGYGRPTGLPLVDVTQAIDVVSATNTVFPTIPNGGITLVGGEFVWAMLSYGAAFTWRTQGDATAPNLGMTTAADSGYQMGYYVSTYYSASAPDITSVGLLTTANQSVRPSIRLKAA